MAELTCGTRATCLVLGVVRVLAVADSTRGGGARSRIREGVAPSGWGCGGAREHLHSDRSSGPLGPSGDTDGADRRRRAGPIDYGAAASRVHRDATGVSRVTGILGDQQPRSA